MINSIYTNREIFLRELISNASDAVDKLYFRSLTDQSIEVTKDDLAIRVSFDAEARTVTVSDNGIGMSKDDLDKNLGTIAHSDSQAFKTENADAQGDNVDIIGQFGVGFYSAFMVASHVRVVSRAYGSDEAWAWESDGVEGYTVKAAERDSHGTDVILTIKEDVEGDDDKGSEGERYSAFLSEYGLRDLIRRYSNYVRYPILMEVTKYREKPQPEPDPDMPPMEILDENGQPIEDPMKNWRRPEYEEYTEIETINSMIPIWKRKKQDVSQEEYNEFYKADFHDHTDPLRTISLHAEGALTYDALLFIPATAPYDLYSKDFKKGLALYSSNVLIMDKCEELLPDYFNFVRGVVDSQDLTLNISRETLQHNGQLKAIARRIEKKIVSELGSMRDNDRETYEKFFENFGRGLKYGIYSHYGMNKETLADLLLFYSAREKKMITLAEYAAAMSEGQEAFYYASGESVELLAKMPIVSTVLSKGYDVLLCTQDVDEFCMMAMEDYAVPEADDPDSLTAVPLKNVAAGDLGLETEEEKKAAEEATEENKGLFEAMQEALDGKVEKVAVSTRLTDAPVCITAEGFMSLGMEKVLQRSPKVAGEDVKAQRVLELNAQHPVFEALKAAHAAGDVDKVRTYTEILYNQALLMEGLPIEDPVAFAQAVASLMK
ncbi:MAG: molecular chaperone HtpG, partial [Eggerthellaceae bacterium]|nr:molecular chaperone HtpG [Eggerthellaceae bacterium]